MTQQDLSLQGITLMDQAKDLVLTALRLHPDGRTSTEVSRDTGLFLEVPKQRGYIAWTILQHLVAEGVL